jgi:pheromone shutdown protein TraB
MIGVGHVFQIAPAIRNAIFALQPDVVFVELDKGRLGALLERRRTGRMPDTARGGFIHGRLARFQERVAKSYGADVGEEMLAAALAGRDVGARVRLIDPPAEDTVGRILKELTWREKARAFGLGAKGALAGLVGKRRTIEQEIQRYEADPEAVLEELRATLPTVHRIAIAERDATMARRIRKGLAGARLGVAVLGDGHVGGVLRHLEGVDVTTYRLADVRGNRLPAPEAAFATGDGSSVSFSWTLGDGQRKT